MLSNSMFVFMPAIVDACCTLLQWLPDESALGPQIALQPSTIG